MNPNFVNPTLIMIAVAVVLLITIAVALYVRKRRKPRRNYVAASTGI